MAIDTETVRRIARLARLELDDPEAFRRHLETILGYVAVLDEVDVGDIAPTAAPGDRGPTLRDDVPHESLSPEAALRNAPEADAGLFRVPRVLDE